MDAVYKECRPAMCEYAKRCDADFHELRDNTRPHPHYAKYDLLTYAFVAGYQRVLFVDADIYIRKSAKSIFDHYRNAALNEFPHMQDKFRNKVTDYIQTIHDKTYPRGTYYNTGVMVFNREGLTKLMPFLQNSKHARGIFWEQEELNYFFWKGKVMDNSLHAVWNQFIWRQSKEPKELDAAHFLHASGIREVKRRVARLKSVKKRFP